MSTDGRNIEKVILETIVELERTTAVETIANFIELLDKIRNSIDFQFYAKKVLIDNIWTPIRENASLMRLVMNGTSKFNSLLGMDDLTEEKINQLLASSLICFGLSSTIVDQEAIEKRTSQTELTKLFDDNKWLVFLIYASMSLGKINELLLTNMGMKSQTALV